MWMNQSQVLGGLEGDKEGRGWGGVEVVEVVRRRWKRVGTALAVRVGTRVVRIAWVRSQFEVRRGEREKREAGGGFGERKGTTYAPAGFADVEGEVGFGAGYCIHHTFQDLKRLMLWVPPISATGPHSALI